MKVTILRSSKDEVEHCYYEHAEYHDHGAP